MATKANFQDMTPPAHGPEGLRSGAVVWHFGWAAAMLLGLLGLLFLPASAFVIAAMVVMVVPGLSVVLVLARDGVIMRRAVVAVWGVFTLLAVALTGGLSGPLAAWAAMPLIAAVALNQRSLITLGATFSCGITLLAATESAFHPVRIPDDQEGFWLSLIAIGTTVGGLSVALLPALRQRFERASGAEEAWQRLHRMLTEQPQLILSLDEQGRVAAAYGEAPAGLDLGALMQGGLYSAVYAPDRGMVRQAVEAALANGRAEVGFMPQNAADHYLYLSLRRADDDRLYGALSDASVRRAREAQLEAARAEADQANRGKSQFLAGMSHELRTPLNAVIGFSDIMRQQMFGPLTPKYAEYAQLIWESGQHVLDLVNDVLDMSKIEAQKYQLSLETFDIRDPVSQSLRLMRGQAHEKAVEIAVRLPQGGLPVTADRRAIKQICLNLLSNAIKFTPRGGRVSLSVGVVGEAVEITVSDTGIGIAPDDLNRIGKPYEQSGTAEQKAMGTGLGLSLVKAFTHLHGGKVRLDSKLGEGTTVTVSLPVLASGGVEVELPFSEGDTPDKGLSGPVNPLLDHRVTPEGLSGFGEFVIRPPKT